LYFWKERKNEERLFSIAKTVIKNGQFAPIQNLIERIFDNILFDIKQPDNFSNVSKVLEILNRKDVGKIVRFF
jgi:hypothetical protein